MARKRHSKLNGLLPVVKAGGPTSHDVVDMARKALRERRIGHTGTLDPMAEGLLLLCVGNATRLQQYLLGWEKTYTGTIRLGTATETYDREGETMEPSGPVPDLGEGALAELAAAFTGTIEQLPPPYSAKKVRGKKLYELAREGETVEVEPKTVTVHALELRTSGPDLLEFEVTCSSGFYVRSLAHDIGVRLGCGAHLDSLRRVAIGPYTVERALPQEALEAASDPADVTGAGAWIPLAEIHLPFTDVVLNPTAADRFLHGGEVIVLRSDSRPVAAGDPIVLRNREGRLLGVGTVATVMARGRTVAIRPRTVIGA